MIAARTVRLLSSSDERRGRPPAPGAKRRALELQLSRFYADAGEILERAGELSQASRERLRDVAERLAAVTTCDCPDELGHRLGRSS